MIFHSPDTTMNRLSSMWKRASKFAKHGEISRSHKLSAAWSNAKLLIDPENKTSDSILENLILLDWFSIKVEKHAETSMLDGDSDFAAICHEWLSFMPCVPIPALQFEKAFAEKHGPFAVDREIESFGWVRT